VVRKLPFVAEIVICRDSDTASLTSNNPFEGQPARPGVVRFVSALSRRHMKVIGFLGALDRLYGVPVTTRNWNTIAAIAKALRNDQPG
jgi:uncharacterized protein (DUF1697 family)